MKTNRRKDNHSKTGQTRIKRRNNLKRILGVGTEFANLGVNNGGFFFIVQGIKWLIMS